MNLIMKKLLFLITFVFSATFLWAQSEAKFNETSHKFGDVPQNVPATTIFKFKNTSKAPLIIETATASCGCTSPQYPKTPILPGKTGDIRVAYNAAAIGRFSKSVTVKFAKVEQPVVLMIEGNVLEKK